MLSTVDEEVVGVGGAVKMSDLLVLAARMVGAGGGVSAAISRRSRAESLEARRRQRPGPRRQRREWRGCVMGRRQAREGKLGSTNLSKEIRELWKALVRQVGSGRGSPTGGRVRTRSDVVRVVRVMGFSGAEKVSECHGGQIKSSIGWCRGPRRSGQRTEDGASGNG